jgi:ketosteroid isomerase-like protein
MKSIIAFLAIASLSCVASTFAQEESPSPATKEQPASATVEETPGATAASETKPTAAPEEKAAAASPAMEKKATKPATTPEKAASSAAAKPAKKLSVEAALKENENRWETAYGSHDTSVAESMVASDFVGVYWDGKLMSKSGSISEMKKDTDTYKSAMNEKLAVHSYGPNVAVVVGTAREKGTGKDGKAFDRTFRFTDTWVERNGQWQCVASQVMKLKG